jgi:thioredoxin reductase
MSDLLNVAILGSGCAGNTAAIYSARANLQPLVLEGHEPGGQLSITTEVENFPGFPEGIQGPALVQNMKEQAQRLGAVFKAGRVVRADLSHRPFVLELEDGEKFETRTLIVATGASARWLNLPSEQKLIGHGVSSCATCDGFFFRGKKIMVIGGGGGGIVHLLSPNASSVGGTLQVNGGSGGASAGSGPVDFGGGGGAAGGNGGQATTSPASAGSAGYVIKTTVTDPSTLFVP